MNGKLDKKLDYFPVKTEIEFLNIYLTKDSSLLLHAIHSPFYWRILMKTILFFGFKNLYKKVRETKNPSLFMNSIFRREKWG